MANTPKTNTLGNQKVVEAFQRSSLVKPHFSTRIFRSYLSLLKKDFPQVNAELLVEKCGLPMSYLDSNENWVSVHFAIKFTEACIEATGRADFPLLAGKVSTNIELSGRPLHFLVSNIFSLKSFYSKIPFYASSFNSVTCLSIVSEKNNGLVLRFEKNPEFLDPSVSVEELKLSLEQGCQNMVGYFYAIPTIQGLPPAAVQFNRVDDGESLPAWEISIEYQVFHPIVQTLIPFLILGGSIGCFYLFNSLEAGVVSLLVGLLAFSFYKFNSLQKRILAFVNALKDADNRFQEIYASQQTLLSLVKSYSRFLSPNILKHLNKKSIFELNLSDNLEKEMTVMFCDIRNFSKLSEELGPQKTFQFINNFLSVFSKSVHANGGFIDKFTGDGIMAIFPDSPQNAVLAGFEMIKDLESFQDPYLKEINHNLNIGIGVNTGRLILGTVGSESYMQTTVFSDAVNVAARLESYCKIVGVKIIIGEATYQALPDAMKKECRYLGQILLRGKEQKVSAFEYFSNRTAEEKILIQKTSLQFEEGLRAYKLEDFQKAADIFNKILEDFKTDTVSKFHLDTLLSYRRRKSDQAA